MVPRPKQVTPMKDYLLEIIFSNGEKRIYDMKKQLERACYKRLKNPAIFNTAKVQDITIEWVTGEDICPDEIYNNSIKI